MKIFKRILILLSLVLASGVLVSFDSSKIKGPRPSASDTIPTNVIFMIGDGMSLPQLYATMLSSDKELAFTKFPYSGILTTKSSSNEITDSAAAGTALACGQKTKNGMVGMNSDSIPAESILEVMADHGKRTGIVVTCYAAHATPAVFYAKVAQRTKYEEIANQMMNCNKLDIMIGGGKKHFTQRKDGRNLINEMGAKGWTVYDDLDGVDVKNERYAVLASDGHLPPAPERGDFLPDGVELALKSLSGSKKGFFLMVEGSQIDMACHSGDSALMVAEMLDFNKAVEEALDFARKDGHTLLIVTADHETGGLTMVDPKGHYADPVFKYSTGSHTCLPVMLFAYGPGAENFSGWMDNTEVKGRILKSCHMKQKKNGNAHDESAEPILINYDTKRQE